MTYTFIHPIKKAIEITADDWYTAQLELLQKVDSILDWELYIPDEIDNIVNSIPLFI